MMELKEFIEKRNRMCKSLGGCALCKMYKFGEWCIDYIERKPQEAEAIVQKWVDEHPVQTNADKFKEVFGFEPNTDTCLIERCPKDTICSCCKHKDWWDKEYIPLESEGRMIDRLALKEMVDVVFSHNQIVSIWEPEDKNYDKRVWTGMGRDIPSEYKDISCIIFGAIQEKITDSDIINIKLLKESEEE